MSPEPGGVSDLLRAWGQGDARAREDLMPLVYRELRRRAGAYLRNERRDHTLQPTALVHEAYVRLVGQDRVTWQNRAQFFGVAAQMMRRILVDHARRHHAAKRPGAGAKVTLDDRIGAAQPYDCEILLLDQALHDLAGVDARQAEIVELRYFGGLSEDGGRDAAVDLPRNGHARMADRTNVALPADDQDRDEGGERLRIR